MAKDQRQSSTRTARLRTAVPYERPEMEVSGFGDEPYFPRIEEEDIRVLRLAQNQPRRMGRRGNPPIWARPNVFPIIVAAVMFFAFFLAISRMRFP